MKIKDGKPLIENLHKLTSFRHDSLKGPQKQQILPYPQVLTISSSVPLRVSAALSAAEESQQALEGILQRERGLSNTLQQHLQGAQAWADSLGQTLGRLDTIERHLKYLQCLSYIEQLR